MCHSRLVLLGLLLVAASCPGLLSPPAANAGIVPNPVCLLGVCDEDGHGGAVGAIKEGAAGPLAGAVVCAVSKIVPGATGLAGDAVAGGLGSLGESAMSGLTSWVAEGAAWLAGRGGQMLEGPSPPPPGGTWVTGRG